MYTHLSINVFRQHNWDSADSQIANLLYDQSSPVCNIFHTAYIIYRCSVSLIYAYFAVHLVLFAQWYVLANPPESNHC